MRRPQWLHLHRHRRHAADRPRPPQQRPGRHRQGAPGAKDIHLEKSPGHHRNWLDCIRSRKRPLADVAIGARSVPIGARSVAITILVNLAYWNGRPLHWDPARWEFVNDAEANRWLDRERRDPWQLPAA
ncbi:MAG TPA: hypothetical protein VKF17_07800 [Isosphaeraceae bacterium]|nr:hypothetical protein [Isosphaeraceae bacterium]